MKSHTTLVLLSICSACLSACALVSLAPGADKIHVTSTPSDVSSCTAVGNLQVPRTGGNVDIANASSQFRNQAIGLGADTALVTYGSAGVPVEGIAYRCP